MDVPCSKETDNDPEDEVLKDIKVKPVTAEDSTTPQVGDISNDNYMAGSSSSEDDEYPCKPCHEFFSDYKRLKSRVEPYNCKQCGTQFLPSSNKKKSKVSKVISKPEVRNSHKNRSSLASCISKDSGSALAEKQSNILPQKDTVVSESENQNSSKHVDIKVKQDIKITKGLSKLQQSKQPSNDSGTHSDFVQQKNPSTDIACASSYSVQTKSVPIVTVIQQNGSSSQAPVIAAISHSDLTSVSSMPPEGQLCSAPTVACESPSEEPPSTAQEIHEVAQTQSIQDSTNLAQGTILLSDEVSGRLPIVLTPEANGQPGQEISLITDTENPVSIDSSSPERYVTSFLIISEPPDSELRTLEKVDRAPQEKVDRTSPISAVSSRGLPQMRLDLSETYPSDRHISQLEISRVDLFSSSEIVPERHAPSRDISEEPVLPKAVTHGIAAPVEVSSRKHVSIAKAPSQVHELPDLASSGRNTSPNTPSARSCVTPKVQSKAYNPSAKLVGQGVQFSETHKSKGKSSVKFKCGMCGATFLSSPEVVDHITNTHRGYTSVNRAKPLEESECPVAVADKNTTAASTSLDISASNKVTMGKERLNSLSCDRCGKIFRKKPNLEAHKRTHKGEKLFCCGVCERTFSTSSNALKHMKTIHPGTDCIIKGGLNSWNNSERKGGSNADSMVNNASSCERRKQSSANSDVDENSVLDTVEESKSRRRVNTKGHKDDTPNQSSIRKDDNNPHACSLCEESFRTGYALKMHRKKVHIDKQKDRLKMMCCKICSKQLSSKSSLVLHMRIHTGEKPFSCKECGRKFSTSSNAYNHARNVHSDVSCIINDKDKQNAFSMQDLNKEIETCLTCRLCGEQFGTEELFLKHQTEKPETSKFICEICGHPSDTSCRISIHKKRLHVEQTEDQNKVADSQSSSSVNLANINTSDGNKSSNNVNKLIDQDQGVNHDKRHTECTDCGKVLASKQALEDHIRTHTGEKPYICEICGWQFRTYSACYTHKKYVHLKTNKTFPCKYCKKELGSKGSLEKHLRTHTGEKPYECGQCGMRFAVSSNVYSHMRHKHQNVKYKRKDNKKFMCQICHKSMAGNAVLQRHMRTHTGEKPYECSICGLKFTMSSNMLKHERWHANPKPHTCDICNRSFSSKFSLREHRTSHTGGVPHVCHICGKIFSSERKLKMHVAVHDIKKKAQCRLCGKILCSNYSLKIHMLVHTGERSFKCELCQKMFKTSSARNAHVRRHFMDEYVHTCDQCPATFRRERALEDHKRIHTSDCACVTATQKKYKCDTCGKEYKHVHSLKRHKCQGSTDEQVELQIAELVVDGEYGQIEEEVVTTWEDLGIQG